MAEIFLNSNYTEVCNSFNGFFSDIISELNIPKKNHWFLNDMDSDSVLSVRNSFKNPQALRISKVKKV